ncbi:bifunctional folylpolyglutamate synthase/dihydrofolate synthase [Lactobacillus gigeriorum]|uniref:tetrahydrofolate synthase n=1 Tax=Lactobacillus gigeriorum DSM 23908 = CRBIP 24.85 TaxID=1423751 RepID=I7KP90_9LACO|nr:folylpolyglutamate synthase/dihydrofolate synthase family protein [Lactobacillus gigeriorum]KRN14747.1 FolC family protein [Lactobacillus gigeriorum DSM 23908 = CRBIP 24.85]CCI87209.1 FolC family protein [Lactobacillus gigeriorum DSM 23908 = CRBIP 24.85]
MNFSTKDEMLSHLYSLPHLHPKNDLTYIKKVLHQLGDPQKLVKIVHVTGTNGKGSTTYYLNSLLKKAGMKTGLFVSPYIKEFNERIQINGENIPDQALIALANQVEVAIGELRKIDPEFSLVTFEYEVALAFLYFAQSKCDYAVIEVGIGGMHDKTNVVDPEVSVITTIGLDHEQIIGPTLADIAHEKSGIIKHHRPVVLGKIPNSVKEIIAEKVVKEKTIAYELGKDFDVALTTELNYSFGETKLDFTLRPVVEAYDIGIAVTAFRLLNIPLTEAKIREAIDTTVIPGRYQIISQKPLIILDGAHNVQAMKNLLQFIHQYKVNTNTKIKILVTMMKDKDLDDLFALFADTDQVVLTSIPYPRAAKLADFPMQARGKYPYIEDYNLAFSTIVNELRQDDIFLVTGSFYLVGAVLNSLR